MGLGIFPRLNSKRIIVYLFIYLAESWFAGRAGRNKYCMYGVCVLLIMDAHIYEIPIVCGGSVMRALVPKWIHQKIFEARKHFLKYNRTRS